MFHHHVLGHVVRRLRELAGSECSPNQILEYLRPRCGKNDRLQYSYLEAAFFPRIPGVPLGFLIPPTAMLTGAAERKVSEIIQSHRAVWSTQVYPELMRLRDYFSFLEFARDERAIVTVCKANPYAGEFVGRDGYRAYAGRLFVASSEAGATRGLITADPTDPQLTTALARYVPEMSYNEYVSRLKALGYAVRPSAEHYVLEDEQGNALYEGYRLHGAYSARSGSPLWSAQRGERLRHDLNRRLGDELVHFGPHDQWEHRNDPSIAGPLSGPQLPAISFDPDGEIDALLVAEDMGWGIPEIEQHWNRLYPNQPVQR